MKSFIQIFLMAMVGLQANAQIVTPDLQDPGKWMLVGRTAESVNDNGKNAVQLSEAPSDGLMILKDFEFTEGTIELDIKGRNVPQQSFVGFAFHIQDSNTYDAVYFRPFNFANADTSRRSRAVQYVSMPGFPWEKLRKEHPGKFENKVNPVPHADEWFHVKISVSGRQIKVFVDHSATPSLQVEKLTAANTGRLALWVGFRSTGTFANLKIMPKGTPNPDSE